MASSIIPAEISVELDENATESKNDDNEKPNKSTEDPHLISTTTGGMENSCHSCMLGFGLVTLIIGISTTSVYYANGSSDFSLSVVGHSVLFLAITCLLFSCAWRYYRKKQKEKIMEDLAELCYENKLKKIRI
uniref:Transmembrane protein 100 n=1 Tax=Pyxicephalus adspersus TaxID=30357 RepID=A0AAV2ZNU2_PYXAD|nr:TPA: hypothetical protein GDO54_003537 [Pyxicephalus adspersus]